METGKHETTDILIVDDNEAILHVLGRVLTKNGYDVILAINGREALAKLAVKAPDLIIIDLDLPDINGLELSKLIGVRCPATKRMILTGLPPEKNELDSEMTPHILVKPLTAEELIAAVKETLNGN